MSTDYVLVYDVDDIGNLALLGRHCVSSKPRGPHSSSWHRMQLNMYTDTLHNGKGFLAHYDSKTFELPATIVNDVIIDGTISCLNKIIFHYIYISSD